MACSPRSLEGSGRNNKATEEKMRMQTYPPDRYSKKMFPECCVPTERQPADSNLMLGAGRAKTPQSFTLCFSANKKRATYSTMHADRYA